ncbi:class I SAM-dependent methyltransferase, partial [Pseudothioclava arenosa]
MKQTPPKGDTYYNKRARNYEARRLKQEWWHVEQDEMKSLLETLPRGLKVVDIPFGTGRFVPFYDELGYQVHGLDASGDMLVAARESLGALYEKCSCTIGSAADLPYEDGAFDRHCCRTLAAKDSHRESMQLDAWYEQAQARPLSHDELVRLQRCA